MRTAVMRRAICRLIIVLCACGIGTVKFAFSEAKAEDQGTQQKEGRPELGGIYPGEEVLVTAEPVQVKGQKIENVDDVKAELARRPGSNILIEEKQITESRAFNLQDILQFAPGVRFQSRFGADEGQFQIRGTSLRNNFHHRGVNILINGIFFGDADGFSDFESIDLLAYERVEVYKGANALRYGANTIGGAINFVPRTGYNATMYQARVEAGSYGTVIGQVSSGKVVPFKLGNLDVTGDYYISATANRQDGFQTNSQQGRQRVNANFGLQLGTHQEIRAYVLQANVSERIPGSLTTAQLFQDRTQAGGQNPGATNNFFACSTSNQTCKYGRYYNLARIGVAYKNEFASGQFFEVIPYYQYQHLDHPIFQTIRQDNSNVGGEFRYANTNSLFGFKNDFIVGQQIRYGDQHQRRFEQQNGSILREAQNAFFRTTYFGTYAEDKLDATEKLTLVAGLRWDYSGRQANVQAFGVFPPAVPFCFGALTDPACPSGVLQTTASLRHYDHVSPKVGFVYKTSATTQIYGNVSNAYEPPLNLELTSAAFSNGQQNLGGFLDLDAQRAWQYELGTRGTTADQRLNWDLTVYDIEMRKEILAANVQVTGGGIQGTYLNANDTRHTGLELGAGYVVGQKFLAKEGRGDQISTRVAYTWSRFVFTQDVFGSTAAGPNSLIAKSGNLLPGAPIHNLNGEVRYDHPRGWWIAPNFEWVPTGFYTDNLNTVKDPAYFVLHLRSGWNYSKNVIFYAEGRNLTNKTYAGAVVVNDVLNRYANPSQGASGYAGVEVKF
jgi:iron complex outermembrane receptor protein